MSQFSLRNNHSVSALLLRKAFKPIRSRGHAIAKFVRSNEAVHWKSPYP